VSPAELKEALSRCDFLFDWQKSKLMGMLENVDEYVNNGDGNDVILAEDVFPVLDNVLWRTIGVGLDSLPVGDRLHIEQAVREVTH